MWMIAIRGGEVGVTPFVTDALCFFCPRSPTRPPPRFEVNMGHEIRHIVDQYVHFDSQDPYLSLFGARSTLSTPSFSRFEEPPLARSLAPRPPLSPPFFRLFVSLPSDSIHAIFHHAIQSLAKSLPELLCVTFRSQLPWHVLLLLFLLLHRPPYVPRPFFPFLPFFPRALATSLPLCLSAFLPPAHSRHTHAPPSPHRALAAWDAVTTPTPTPTPTPSTSTSTSSTTSTGAHGRRALPWGGEFLPPMSMTPPRFSGLLSDFLSGLLLAVPKSKQSRHKRMFKMQKQYLKPVKQVAMCPKCLRVMGVHEVPYECTRKETCPSMGFGAWPPRNVNVENMNMPATMKVYRGREKRPGEKGGARGEGELHEAGPFEEETTAQRN